MKLNDKIFEYRKINNWSQEELADKLDVSRQTISKWETGKAVPELDKLISLANLFNISVDTLVKEEIDIEDQDKDRNSEKTQNELWNKICRKFKSKEEFIKKLITAIIISAIIIVGYKAISNKVNLYKRENDIEKVMNAYKEVVNYEGSYRIWEKYSKKENDKIIESNRMYDMYFEDNKRLVKVTEYEGDNSEKIIKQIYLDLSNIKEGSYDWKTNTYRYNGVVEVYTNDWSHKIIDDYEFISPLDRIRNVLDENYFNFGNPSKIIAENPENTIVALEWKKQNVRNYSWSFGDSNNLEKEDVLSLTVIPDSKWIAFYSDDYKNDIAETREIVSIQMSKIKPNIDDVTVPEL